MAGKAYCRANASKINRIINYCTGIECLVYDSLDRATPKVTKSSISHEGRGGRLF